MIFQRILIFSLILLICSCNLGKSMEESVIIYDPVKQDVFIGLLKEKKIDYRVEDDGQIFYPVEENELVKEAFEIVMGSKIPELEPPANPSGM